MQVREKVEKSRNTVFFPMFCGSGGSKSRLAKAAGAEHRCGAKHISKPECQNTPTSEHFWKLRCSISARCCGAARSTCGSQNVNNTSCSEHLWKLRCSNSARHCDAKHMWKSKC